LFMMFCDIPFFVCKFNKESSMIIYIVLKTVPGTS